MVHPSRRRSAALGLAAALAAGVAGCTSDGAEDAPARVLAAADVGSATSLPAEELLSVTLEAHLSTGYGWQVDEIDGAVLRLAGREQRASPVLGGEDQEILRFAGVARGRTSLGLFYRRPWDPPGSGERSYRVEVEVEGAYAGAYRAPELAAAIGRAAAVVGDGSIPTSYDACASEGGGRTRCTPVKDQGVCGGCWAFATAGVLENVLFLGDPSRTPDLSEQYLISCNREGWGCDGGWAAFDYYIDRMRSPPETEAGAVYEADFAYAGQNLSCGSSAHPHHERAASWAWISGSTLAQRVLAVKQAILAHGPVWTTVCADHAFQAWTPAAGVFAGSGCTEVNHAVVLVGWDDAGGDGHWILRNSWGPRWGDRGYMRIAWGANAVGQSASYVVYQGSNELPVALAGAPQTVDAGARVALDGSSSADPDGSLQGFAWVQTAGPAVALANPASSRAAFTAPAVAADTTLAFRLTVEDDRGARSSAGTTVTVRGSPPAPTDPPLVGPGGVTGGCATGAGGLLSLALLALPMLGRRTRERART